MSQTLGEELAPYTDPTPVEREIAAMSAVSDAFDGLDDAARKRVLEWASSRYPFRVERDIIKFLDGFLQRIHEHQVASLKQPRNADRALWDATIRGSKYWTEPPAAEDRSSSGE